MEKPSFYVISQEDLSKFLEEIESRIRPKEKKYVYGLRGISQLFNCGISKAQYIKDHIIQDAVTQIGRKIMVDADEAITLYQKANESTN